MVHRRHEPLAQAVGFGGLKFDDKTLRILQMRANAEALFRHYGIFVPRVVLTFVDRTVFVESELFMLDFLPMAQKELPDGSLEPFDKAIHRFKHWTHGIDDHKFTDQVSAIEGWHEYTPTNSIQIIRHDWGVIECDIDRFNPDFGLAPLIGHGIECLWPGKTDSFKVARGLRKRGIPVTDVRL